MMSNNKLVRSSNDAVLGGVCSGIARYFGWKPGNVRLAWIIFMLLGGSGILVYLVLWLLLPSR
jgi:phage shock protein C